MTPQTKYPFKVPYAEIEANVDAFVDTVFGTLQSSFLLLPRGPGFVFYPDFQQAYEVLKRHTFGFSRMDQEQVMGALAEDALVLVVLRTILGFTPSELAYEASKSSSARVSQGFARTLDRHVRTNRQMFQSHSYPGQERLVALVAAACHSINSGVADIPQEMIHRLDKVDTCSGSASIRHLATEGVPYAMLLYERFLGRPFAGHRDSVSELVGEVMESAVEERLRQAGVSFRKTKRAEKIEGFDQSPDFIVPDEWSPQVVIEAKITEDDGTARDKVTRIQHLAELSRQRRAQGLPGFQVIACIDGRGFAVRRGDMRKLFQATQGKVFTLKVLDHLVENTALKGFCSSL
ncbi:MAG: hypothetical protein JXM73_14605 [Anaerolineae bacterium]|nr:hypothetical protein [Anaerolineae bacterium]